MVPFSYICFYMNIYTFPFQFQHSIKFWRIKVVEKHYFPNDQITDG